MRPRVPIVDRLRRLRRLFASHAEDYWAGSKIELRHTYQSHGICLAAEKAIISGYVTKSGESCDLAPYDDTREIARARRPRRARP